MEAISSVQTHTVGGLEAVPVEPVTIESANRVECPADAHVSASYLNVGTHGTLKKTSKNKVNLFHNIEILRKGPTLSSRDIIKLN